MADPLTDLSRRGVSIWLDDLSRVSRVDTEVDARLDKIGTRDRQREAGLATS